MKIWALTKHISSSIHHVIKRAYFLNIVQADLASRPLNRFLKNEKKNLLFME